MVFYIISGNRNKDKIMLRKLLQMSFILTEPAVVVSQAILVMFASKKNPDCQAQGSYGVELKRGDNVVCRNCLLKTTPPSAVLPAGGS